MGSTASLRHSKLFLLHHSLKTEDGFDTPNQVDSTDQGYSFLLQSSILDSNIKSFCFATFDLRTRFASFCATLQAKLLYVKARSDLEHVKADVRALVDYYK